MFCVSCGLPRGTCAKCGVRMPDGSEFCWKCGHANPKAPSCKKCSALLSIGSLFCSKCGCHQGEDAKDAALSSRKIIHMLSKIPVLNKLNEGEKLALGGMCKEKVFNDNVAIFKQNDTPDGFYIIVTGKARVLYTDPNTKSEHEVGRLSDGDYFGETALLSNDNRTATIMTSGPVRCLFLDREQFIACFSNKSDVQFAVRRVAVSAETVAKEPSALSKTSREMTKNVRDMLLESTGACPLFSNLDYNHRLAVVMSMYAIDIPQGFTVIKQGELGSNLYVVERGSFEVTITDSKTRLSSRVGLKGPRSLFGELALMYNAPRAATVTATSDSVVWLVDRFTFRRIASDLGTSKMNQHKEFMRQVPILAPLTEFEREKIAEALEEVCFVPKTVIFQQGSVGDNMYIVSKGEVDVSKDGKVISRLTVGAFFGELALLNNTTRAATVTTVGEVECLKLDRHAVKLLLGPIDLLGKAQELYGAGAVKTASTLLSSASASPSAATSTTSSSSSAAAASSTATHASAAAAAKEEGDADNKLLTIKQDDLKVLGTLGKGSFGHVQLVQDKSGNVYALKGVNKKQIVETQQQSHIMSEKWALCQLKHPFIIRLFATFRSVNKLYFLLEPALGGELFTFLRKRKLFTEDWSRFYAGCVVLAFEYMHSKDILYRDLKPENLLMGDDGFLKVTDFGFAKKVVGKTWTLCGTPDYLAPEIVASKGHGKGVDYWTLGVLIYEMIASYPPFYDEDPMQTYAKIVEGTVKYPSHFSQNAKLLISQLLHPNTTQRLGCTVDGARGIKSHKWFYGFDWDALFNKTMKSPYIPKIKSNTDTSNFIDYGGDGKDDEMIYVDDGTNWDKEF